jgi:S1-C subfamily serine protease
MKKEETLRIHEKVVVITMRYYMLLLILFAIPLCMNAHKINGYKYIHIEETGNIYGIEDRLTNYFTQIGFKAIASYEFEDMSNENKSLLLIASYKWEIVNGGHSTLIVTLSDITGSVIYKAAGQGIAWTAKGDMKNALKKIFKQIDNLHYKFDITQNKAKSTTNSFTSWSEDSIKNYLKSKSHTSVEGIYKNFTNGLAYYKIAVMKDKDKFYGIIIDTDNSRWKKGDVKFVLSHVDHNIYDIDYYDFKGKKTHAIGEYSNRILEMMAKEFDEEEKMEFVKIYPAKSASETSDNSSISDIELKSTGSGFVISGNVIATNYHVVSDAEKIKVLLNVNGAFEEYSARILSTDKTNDLALLTIKDDKFRPLSSAPYSIIANAVDVGTSVFTMGYPMSNVLGNEVKITDGIISSKTGYEGDAVTYQISAPIQPGNSGGALFDKKGHLIGITNAGIPSADNVGYAIKSSYLINLIDSAPIDIPLPKGIDTTNKELSSVIKVYTPYIAFIKIY